MIDVSKVYNPNIFIFRSSMYAWVVVDNELKRVPFDITPEDKFITPIGRFNLVDVLIFRSQMELDNYIQNHPLENKLYIEPTDIQEFIVNALNDIMIFDSEYWVKEFGCKKLDEVFKQHNYLVRYRKVVVQIGEDINYIPLSLNILFDTLGKLDSVETARKVIDDIDDLCD